MGVIVIRGLTHRIDFLVVAEIDLEYLLAYQTKSIGGISSDNCCVLPASFAFAILHYLVISNLM